MSEALNLYKQFKLGSSLFKGQWQAPDGITDGILTEQYSLLERAKQEMSIQLARKILDEHKSIITYENKNGQHEYRAELLVLKKEDLKLIVEGAIVSMTDEQISRIRQGV